jgi:hypothetical protein
MIDKRVVQYVFIVAVGRITNRIPVHNRLKLLNVVFDVIELIGRQITVVWKVRCPVVERVGISARTRKIGSPAMTGIDISAGFINLDDVTTGYFGSALVPSGPVF